MPKIVNHDERRNEIINAVVRIVIREGFDRVTMREIAEELGYAHGALNRYFPNKQSLLAAVFVQLFDESLRGIETRIEDVRGLTALEYLLEETLPLEEDSAQRAKVVLSFWDRAAQDPELWQIHHRQVLRRRELIRRTVTEAQEDGELVAGAEIEDLVNRISAYNAGWQMMSVLVPEVAQPALLTENIQGLIKSLRAPR